MNEQHPNRRVWEDKEPKYCVERCGTAGNAMYENLNLKGVIQMCFGITHGKCRMQTLCRKISHETVVSTCR